MVSTSTHQERLLLHHLMKEMTNEFSTNHYTFEYNPDLKDLELIQKTSPSCNTRHCLTKSELYNWYSDELEKVKQGKETYATQSFKEYAMYYDMGYNTYIGMITAKIKDAIDNHPEYFI